jgi:hypothetical protein
MDEKRIPRNPAALRALLTGDEKNFVVAQMPGGIEAQEAMAQRDLVESQKLPKKGTIDSPNTKAKLEALGFVFGAEVDDLFISCQFPQGWSIKPTDHSMWSFVYDDQGVERMRIFYKGAFYDRRAHAHLNEDV